MSESARACVRARACVHVRVCACVCVGGGDTQSAVDNKTLVEG